MATSSPMPGWGSIAPTYTVAKPTRAKALAPGVKAAGKHDPTPSQPASAGTQAPVTLQVKAPSPQEAGRAGRQDRDRGLI